MSASPSVIGELPPYPTHKSALLGLCNHTVGTFGTRGLFCPPLIASRTSLLSPAVPLPPVSRRTPDLQPARMPVMGFALLLGPDIDSSDVVIRESMSSSEKGSSPPSSPESNIMSFGRAED